MRQRLRLGAGVPATFTPRRAALCASLALALGAAQPGGAGEALEPAEVLGPQNWQKAESLLPPEILKHYREGEYRNPIALWDPGWVRWGPEFLRHSSENERRLALDAKGSIVDRVTGQRPAYLYGLPFPTIDPSDPEAGAKIVWNYFYRTWSSGNFHIAMQLNWVSRRGLDRSTIQDVYYLYYTGQLRDYVPSSNPEGLTQQFLTSTLWPADLQGTVSLGWRYLDPDKRDSLWVYIPALRRVRAVSPANRSDGFLGSDMSQDDGPFFDGKPEDFRWALTGEVEVLRLVDPHSLRREAKLSPLPGGGWRVQFARAPMVGFQDPHWSGVAWAPVNLVLARRKCWVVEGVPKDRYYLYGKIQLYIDKETYQGAYNRKFDWKGKLVNTYAAFANMAWVPWGDEIGGTGLFYQGAENVLHGRATVATVPQSTAETPADWRIRLDPGFFDFQALTRFGK